MKNEKIYTLPTIRRMLDLADHFISYHTPGIFREPGSEEAFTALKEIALSIQSNQRRWKKNSTRNIAHINKKVNAYIDSKKEPIPDSDVVSATEDINGKSEEEPAEVIEPINLNAAEDANQSKTQVQSASMEVPTFPLEWARLYKHLIQHGQILDNNSLDVNASWHILLHQLRRIQNAFVTKAAIVNVEKMKNLYDEDDLMPINKKLVRKYLLDFIGQLCLIGHTNSAKVIHNYIHLAAKVFEAQKADTTLLKKAKADKKTIIAAKQSGMQKESAGSMILAVLLAGLDLSEILVIPQGDLQNQELGTQLAEALFFKKLTPAFITEPTFQQPFDVKLYDDHQQKKELHKVTLAAAKKVMWKEIPRFDVPLADAEFHRSPRDDQSAIMDVSSSNNAPPAGTNKRNKQRDSQDKKSKIIQFFKQMTVGGDSHATATQSNTPRPDSPKKGNVPSGNVEQQRSSPTKGVESPREVVSQRDMGTPRGDMGSPRGDVGSPRAIIITRTNSHPKLSGPIKPGSSSPQSNPPTMVSFAPIESSSESSEERAKRPITPSFKAVTARPMVASSPIQPDIDNLPGNVIGGGHSAFAPVKKI